MKSKIIFLSFFILLSYRPVYSGNEGTDINKIATINHDRFVDMDAFFVLNLGLNIKENASVPDQNIKRSEALCADQPGCEYPPIMCMKLYNWGCSIACCNVCYCPGPPF